MLIDKKKQKSVSLHFAVVTFANKSMN